MGQAKVRAEKKRQEILDAILAQQHEPDIVQIPIQLGDGWYRGVLPHVIPWVTDLWEPHKRDRQLWVYYINKFWVHQSWKTPQGNYANRGDLILTVESNALSKELWLNTVSQPHLFDSYKDQIEVVKKGENGCVQFWWLRRYLLCRASLGLQKSPVNQWDYYPLVQVFHPDGSTTEQALDLTEIDHRKTLFQDPKEVASPAPWEIKVFNDCITEEIVK